MSRIYLLSVASLLVASWFSSLAGRAQAYSGPGVVISEVQTGSALSANEEFIEIKNLGEDSVDITNWRLEYKSATGLTWSSKASLSGELHPGGTLLAATTNYLTDMAAARFAAGLSKTGGNVRLASTDAGDGSVFVHDALGWGNGNAAEGGAPAIYANEGKSMSRVATITGELQDTNNNLFDFVVNDTPTPEAHNPVSELPPEIPAEETTNPEPTNAPEPSATELETPATTEPLLPPLIDPVPIPEQTLLETPAKPLIPLMITELLANPASPVSDSEGEYIELYNGGESTVSLRGFKLQTGLKSSYSYTFQDVSIETGKYMVFFSKDTGLSLSNASGKARLVTPDGAVVFETATYGAAKDGVAWVLAEGHWVWSTQPTPAAENVVVTIAAAEAAKIAEKAESRAALKAVNKKVPAPKAAKATKTTKPKTTKPKTTKLKNAASVRKIYTEPARTDLKTPIHYGVLAGIGSITLLYALYEYRTDFQNRLFQLRRYLAYRRRHRQATEGQ